LVPVQWDRFGKGLLVIFVLEASLGGGGRLIETGPVSPRMVLFGLALAYSAAILFRGAKLPREFVWLTGLFVTLSSISALRSVSGGQSSVAAFEDFKPLAYFLILPFFAITIRTVNDVMLVGRLLKLSALILALSYLAILAVWKAGFFTAEQMIGWFNPTHDPRLEFYFRGYSTFYFKAIFYVGIGVFFFVTEQSAMRRALCLLPILAAGLTMTRGIWLSIFLLLAAWSFFYSTSRLKGTLSASLLFTVGIVGVLLMTVIAPTAEISDSARARDVAALLDRNSDWDVTMLGHGFGATVLGKRAIEITYVNILFKQGIAGLLFWALPIAYGSWQMLTMQRSGRVLAMPWFIAMAFAYLVSVTNPFLTNPIGMSVVLIAIVALRVIAGSTAATVSPQATQQRPINSVRSTTFPPRAEALQGKAPISPDSA